MDSYELDSQAAALAIGPTTAEAVKASWSGRVLVARRASREGLVEAVKDFLSRKP